MLNQPLEPKGSVDQKTAEEALALAIRLQQQGGDKVSIEQLQKTAEEAGIDREYLNEALAKIHAEKNAPPVPVTQDTSRETRRLRAMMASMFASMFVVMLAMKGSGSHDAELAMMPMISAMLAVFVVIRIKRRRR